MFYMYGNLNQYIQQKRQFNIQFVYGDVTLVQFYSAHISLLILIDRVYDDLYYLNDNLSIYNLYLSSLFCKLVSHSFRYHNIPL